MTASQDLSETEEDFSLYKTQFKFETNPSADFTLKMYAIFVPEDDPTYQIWWMGDGVSLTLWTYDDAHPDGYARVVQNGEILTYADLKSSSLSFTVTLDAQVRGSSKVTMNLLAYDGYGNSLGNDALNADVLPVEITIRKKGTNAPPEDGLVVKKSDVIEVALAPEFFDQADNFENVITWQYRQLKADGDYTPWTNFGANATGTRFEYTTTAAGIFQIKAFITNVGEFFHVRKQDDPHSNLKKDDPDAFGVVDANWQIQLRNAAKDYLGSTQYSTANDVPPIPAGSPKCNIFVAHCGQGASVAIPWINGNNPFNPYPPVANQWAGVPPNPPNNPAYESLLSPWWVLLPQNTYPQPGYIGAKGFYTWAHGHCGIVDYDGQWISASKATDTVNRQASFANQRSHDLQNNEILPRIRKSTAN